MLEVLEDVAHMSWFREDVLETGENPSSDSRLFLDLFLNFMEVLYPSVDNSDSLFDNDDRLARWLLEY